MWIKTQIEVGLHERPLTKDMISKLETKMESIQKYVREYTCIIYQQIEELSQLREKLESLESQKNVFPGLKEAAELLTLRHLMESELN